jgi:hypothetical protein
MTDRDPFEDRLRETLRSGDGSEDRPDVDGFLTDVHEGARTRRRRRAVGIVTATTLVVVGAGAAVAAPDLLKNDATPAADQTTNITSATSEPTETDNTRPSVTPTTPTPATALDVNARNSAIVSVTSTGTDHQWALAKTKSRACPEGWCATLFARSAVDDTWASLGQLPYGAYTENGPEDVVRQVRFVGTATDGYNGWAYGPGLLSMHGDATASSWQPVRSPKLGKYDDQAIGNVSELAARGDMVYALIGLGESDERLISSPADHDDWSAVDVGPDIGHPYDLNVSQGVVAFISVSGADAAAVKSSAADPDTGAATGDWKTSQPCSNGGVEQLSSAAYTLWALCSDGTVSTASVDETGEPAWTTVAGGPFDPTALIAANGSTSAVIAELTGLSRVARGAADATHLSSKSFANADVFGFTNDTLGFAVNDGQLLRTDDAGTSWTEEKVLPPVG